MKEKILISENAIQADSIISNTKDAVDLINSSLLGHIKALGIEVTNEVVQDLFKGQNKTEKQYMETLETDLKKIGTPSIKEGMRITALGAWENFGNKFNSIKRDVKSSYQYITIVDGQAVLSPENEERIREQYRKYTTSPQEVEAYKLHQEIASKLNAFFKGNIPFGWPALWAHEAGNFTACEMRDYSHYI